MHDSARTGWRWAGAVMVLGVCGSCGPTVRQVRIDRNFAVGCSDTSQCTGAARKVCGATTDANGAISCKSGDCSWLPDPNNPDCICVDSTLEDCGTNMVRRCVVTKSNGPGQGNEAANWGPCESTMTTTDSGTPTTPPPVLVECTAGSTRPCAGPEGCGGGNEACGADNKWSHQCNGAALKTCASGWAMNDSRTACTRADESQLNMYEKAGGDGYDFGRVSVSFDLLGGTVSAKINIRRASGGCWNGDTPDAIMLFCEKLSSRDLTQCGTGAPDWGGKSCPGITIEDVGAWCELHKIKGWTPPGQGTCNKVATLTYTATVAPRCSW